MENDPPASKDLSFQYANNTKKMKVIWEGPANTMGVYQTRWQEIKQPDQPLHADPL